MNNIKIKCVNFDITWKKKEDNFNNIEKIIENISADIFLLPEMFSTGFCMDAAEIADYNWESLTWMQKIAKQKNSAIAGSVSVEEKGKFFNRFYFVKPDGSYHEYDKRHLFSYAKEEKIYEAGNARTIVDYKGWRILLQVCYDLRFPVFARNNNDYDGAFYVANWPNSRIDAWKTLLKARAIENQSYVFGVNRIGMDGNQLEYPESSYCFFADGKIISTEEEENIISAEWDAEQLKKFRNHFQFLNDRDEFQFL